MTLTPISPQDAQAKVAAGSAVFVDIREQDEFARAHIDGAHLAPASQLGSHSLALESGKTPIFLCRSGMRTQSFAADLLAKGGAGAMTLEGGLDAWRKAGLPVTEDKKAPLEIMRQVQITAGCLILLGVGLGFLLHPGFFGLAGFVGAGLTFAGASGWCGMAKLLALMPWNRSAATPAS